MSVFLWRLGGRGGMASGGRTSGSEVGLSGVVAMLLGTLQKGREEGLVRESRES